MASTTTSDGTSVQPQGGAAAQPKRGFKQILRSYFYWTYSRGSFHYDVMVTLILLFIFITPHLWEYGATPSSVAASNESFQVVPSGRGVIITMQASAVSIPPGASIHEVKSILRKAVEPVTGDDVYVERWVTATDSQGNLTWKVWAHR
jgi:hypothetical protein